MPTFAPPPKPAEGDVAANAAATGRNLLNLGQAVGKAGVSFGTAVVEEAKVADIGSPSRDAFKAAKEAGGLLVDQEFEKLMPKLGEFGAAVGAALQRFGSSVGAATKDVSTKERLREAAASSVKVADSFALFVKAAQQKALPEGDP
eukprot:Transcript_703.p3 GENE.Transcript_703~~Transcript_703.p3  ORF type:complete len:159 (+),score=73.02 Transcript_703:40-477(+)